MYGETQTETEYRKTVADILLLDDTFIVFGHLSYPWKNKNKTRADAISIRQSDFSLIMMITCKELKIKKHKLCYILKHEVDNRHSITNCNGHMHFLVSSYGIKEFDKDKFIITFKRNWKKKFGSVVVEEFDYKRSNEGFNYISKVKKFNDFVFSSIVISRPMKRRLRWLLEHSLNGSRIVSRGFDRLIPPRPFD